MIDVQKLLKLAGEATPGPWSTRLQQNKSNPDLGWIVEYPNGRIAWASLAYAYTNKEATAEDPAREANARLIAACSPEAIKALCEVVVTAKAHAYAGPLAVLGTQRKLMKALEPFSVSMDVDGGTVSPGASRSTTPTGKAEVAGGDGGGL